jgi:hypothetical protein
MDPVNRENLTFPVAVIRRGELHLFEGRSLAANWIASVTAVRPGRLTTDDPVTMIDAFLPDAS